MLAVPAVELKCGTVARMFNRSSEVSRMNWLPDVAIALDMDGVIFRTTLPKRDAMLCLFPPESRSKLSSVVLSLSGVPRKEKLSQVHLTLYGAHPSRERLAGLLAEYEIVLASQLARPILTPGLTDFLKGLATQKCVCSSAPVHEVLRQLEGASLTSHFKLVFGAPTSKTEALREFRKQAGGRQVVFFGDAAADRQAARAAGVGFVAVVGEYDQFNDASIPKIEDFVDEQAVWRAIRVTLANNAAPFRSEPKE